MLCRWWIFDKQGLFLCVYEQRDKFKYVIEKGIQGKNNVIRDFSSCVVKKSNGCDILKAEIKNEEKKLYIPVHIVYVPVKGHNEIINC